MPKITETGNIYCQFGPKIEAIISIIWFSSPILLLSIHSRETKPLVS
jgi:hypothetical protein